MEIITLYSDGGARGNPGPAGIGVQILDAENAVMAEVSEYIGETTNNVAEYTALKRGLETVITLVNDSMGVKLTCHLDSQLVERQLNGAYKVKDQNLKTYFDAIKKLETEFASVTYVHVPRAENKEADRLANEAMDAK